MSSKLGQKIIKHSVKHGAEPSSHRFLIGPPLVVISLFCFGFVLINPYAHKRPVLSRPSSTSSSRRKQSTETINDSHLEKLDPEPTTNLNDASSSVNSTNNQSQNSPPIGSSKATPSSNSGQNSSSNDKNQSQQSKNPITPLINKLTNQL